MSASIIELENLSPEEIKDQNDSKFDFRQHNFKELPADHCSLELYCSLSAPAGKLDVIFI